MKVITALWLVQSLFLIGKGDIGFIDSDDFVAYLNQQQTSWVAHSNFSKNLDKNHLKIISSGARLHHHNPHHKTKHRTHKNTSDIPEHFDARLQWPFCESISEIRDQGSCGACWAFGAAEAMTDRICIISGGTTKFKFSPEDLLSSCPQCGDCTGGYAMSAWEHWVDFGVVSGSDVGSYEGCKPYSDLAYYLGIAPSYSEECQSDYPLSYQEDKHFGVEHYTISRHAKQIQKEIMTHGPVQAFMETYEDLYHYISGVYKHVTGDYTGNHFVKIIGWGTENGKPYWLVANSWGPLWGENGFFKIIRGHNHIRIEEQIDAGIPRM